MAYAQMDPKKAKALREAAEREIADILAREAREKQIREEVRRCYDEHAPSQLKHAGDMMRAHDDGARKVRTAEDIGINVWERIGRSNGGGRKRNLYVCRVN